MGSILILSIIAVIALIGLIVGVFIRNRDGYITAAIAAIVFIAAWIFFSVVQIDTGHGGVRASFGAVNVEAPVLEEGLKFKKPWESIYTLSHQQLSSHRNAKDGNAARVQAQDNIPMDADMSYHWVLNYEAMAWIRQQYGQEYWKTLVLPSAASAMRSAASQFDTWDQLMNERELFAQRATAEFEKAVKAKMQIKGIPETIFGSAFAFPAMDVRKVVPVDQGLLEQISLTQEAREKGQRKQTEIENARLDAQKRGEDGTAIRQTILRVLHSVDAEGALPEDADIPEGTSLAQISQFILAIAEVKRADAVEIAAEKGDLTVMVTSSGANTSLQLPAAPSNIPVAVPAQE
jgi:hypothetical protein